MMWNRPMEMQTIKKTLNQNVGVNRRAVEVRAFRDLLEHVWYHLCHRNSHFCTSGLTVF